MARYDCLGIGYPRRRRPDARIAAVILNALGDAETILNVGAGTGAYEPRDRRVTAVDPSLEMIRNRTAPAPTVQALAEHLPFARSSFDAAMAILTIHHWSDQQAGLRGLRRVARGPVVLLTFDGSCRPWLTDYLPALVELDEATMPAMDEYARWLGDVRVIPVPIPHDCSDGFLHVYWRRPKPISTRTSAPAVSPSG